jgi:hypothetical protein
MRVGFAGTFDVGLPIDPVVSGEGPFERRVAGAGSPCVGSTKLHGLVEQRLSLAATLLDRDALRQPTCGELEALALVDQRIASDHGPNSLAPEHEVELTVDRDTPGYTSIPNNTSPIA